MSDIQGTGYGSSHDWQAGFTGPAKGTPYTCRHCGQKFTHWYDATPNIFQAMRQSGTVSEHCPAPAHGEKP